MNKYFLIWEYNTVECDPAELFQTLTDNGKEGWEFCTLVIAVKMVVSQFEMSKPPQQITTYVLIFKRQESWQE